MINFFINTLILSYLVSLVWTMGELPSVPLDLYREGEDTGITFGNNHTCYSNNIIGADPAFLFSHNVML